MPTCANAAPTLHYDQTVAAVKIPFAVFCALQFFIPDLSYSRGFLPRNWHETDRSAHRTETEIATSTLLRIAFEYGQIARAPWNAGIDDHSDQRRDLWVDPNFPNF